ncbi:hypothetical protein KUTeg_004940 [Tegillarca granosa]|uniref:Uncharacterized protein n=1 Tax=Tegillarca granosa TaxID=220873 RepID=A0ABQ9FLI5_TEGGR|nr:hypothetical protein KUTeg_004940 [Tegillarca granosa]
MKMQPSPMMMNNSGNNIPPAGDPFYSSPFSNFYRRHTPYMGQPDYRIHELNKRLQQRTEDSDNLWWDAFATEFFEDDATLTLSFYLEDGPKRYSKDDFPFNLVTCSVQSVKCLLALSP